MKKFIGAFFGIRPSISLNVNYDHDVVSTGVSNQRGMEFITGPTIRKIGVGLSLTF